MNFEKYHKIRTLGHEENMAIFADPEDDIVIEEKIDGANFRFMFKDGKVIFGSRSLELDTSTTEGEKNAKTFLRCIQFVRDNIEKAKLMPGIIKNFEYLIFYGENCVRHTMPYDWEKIPPYLGFDIKTSLKGDNLDNIKVSDTEHSYLDYKKKKYLFRILGLPMVPLIKIVKAKDMKELTDKNVPQSAYPSPSSKDQQAEGIVFKNYKRQLFGKYVRDKFKEANAETFGGVPKIGKADTAVVCMKYCTNPRIDKIIFKLIDEGNKLEMRLMEFLPKRVYKDIWEEHWQDMMNSRFTVDFKQLRKLVTRRCLAVLKQVITNNALNKEEIK